MGMLPKMGITLFAPNKACLTSSIMDLQKSRWGACNSLLFHISRMSRRRSLGGGGGFLKDLQLLPGGVGPPQGLTPTAAPGGRTPPEG